MINISAEEAKGSLLEMEAKLLTALKSGENYHIEFKYEIVSNNELSKESVAFANSEGGAIYFGIRDDASIVGVPYDASLEEKLINDSAAKNHFQ